MIGTMTVLAYLLGHDVSDDANLHLRVVPAQQQNQSPRLIWKSVPPETDSIALIIKSQKTQYYWVVYNLPADATQLPFGANQGMSRNNEGTNSFGQQNYHPYDASQPIVIELFALDKRFSADYAMTGEALKQKIQGHVLAETTVRR